MIPERTELEWTYQPVDFFEAPYRHADSEFDLVIENGRAVATLRVAQDPVDSDLDDRIGMLLGDLFLVRQLQVHRQYKLQGSRVSQHLADRKRVAIRMSAAAGVLLVCGGDVDFVVRDATGNIIRDTKTERIAEHTALLDSMAPKLAGSSTLRGLLTSYSQAITDPDNELIHLYEVRDALAQHFGRQQRACTTLAISETEWKRLGWLANVEPLEQGRHRGRHVAGRRVATTAELEEARGIIRRWITAFSRTI
jgi:hypothetical protein